VGGSLFPHPPKKIWLQVFGVTQTAILTVTGVHFFAAASSKRIVYGSRSQRVLRDPRLEWPARK
jgi:hypothetical protein